MNFFGQLTSSLREWTSGSPGASASAAAATGAPGGPGGPVAAGSSSSSSSSNGTTTINPVIAGADDDDKIVMVLDSSGSMQTIKQDIIGSVNEFIAQQQKLPDSASSTFSLLQFGAKLHWVTTDVALSSITPLTDAQYKIGGGTPLFDGIGTAIETFDRFRGVSVVIVTDGEENTSTRFTQAQVKEMMAKKKAEADWDFVYLSADEAGFKAGAALGVSNNMCASKEGMSAAMSSGMSSAVFAKRVQKSAAASSSKST